MNGYYEPRKPKKTLVAFVAVLALAGVLTLSLLVYLVVFALQRNITVNPAQAEPEPEIYSQQDRWEYWRGFDATALAAVVCHADPNADRALLAEGEDENFIKLQMQTDAGPLGLHFSLRSTDMTFHSEFEGYNRGFLYTSRIYERVENPRELQRHYGGHLKELGIPEVACIEKDVDGDGVAEFVYLAKGLMEEWLAGGDASSQELDACQTLLGKTVCTYLDTENGNLYVHSFAIPGSIGEITDALWDNGMLHLLHDGGVYRLFVTEPALLTQEHAADAQTLQRICSRYRTYLTDQGYTDVRMRLADISAAPGQEILCCCSDGTEYIVKVLAHHNGRMQELLSKRGTAGAVYLVNFGSAFYLLDYSQTLSGTDYSLNYSYSLFSFDADFHQTVQEEERLWVAADEGGGQSGAEFFRRVDSYLDSGSVCYDPYGLTGYTLMQGAQWNGSQQGNAASLNITNCSTNKVGVVTLQDDDSWLHLRSGPSTNHNIVLITPGDEDSCVKQVQGSLVTVIMPHNTGDRTNPIWAQIRISYQNRTMEGYSSQRYIRIDGIRHLTPGEQFAVEVDNYTSALSWTSSDPGIAHIDPTSGVLTAYKSGLVLITVRNEAGLEDSCLIMID